jgi:hypothetical protein
LPETAKTVKEMTMNGSSYVDEPLTMPEKLALAQRAFREFHSRCFWFMREDLTVEAKDFPAIIRGLRSHGNREAFFVAAKLCR